MPPRRKASGETTAAGSSRKPAKSSSGKNQPTDSGKEVQEETPSPRLLFVANNRFRHGNRPLNQDEILGMVANTWTKTTDEMKKIGKLLVKIDNPNDPFTLRLEFFIGTNDQQLLDQVTGMFNTFVQADEEAADKCRNLEGLAKRLPKLAMQSPVKWAGKEMRQDQLMLCYAMLNYCKDHSNMRLSSEECKNVLQQKVFNNVRSTSNICEKLLDEKDYHYRYLSATIEADQDVKEHFVRRAQDFLTEYELAKGIAQPLLVAPIKPRRVDLTLESDLAITTKGVDTLSLTATAPGSRQPTGTSTGKDILEDMFNWDKYGAKDPGVSSPPAESSDSEPTGKGKGKRKENEEGKGKGKGKEKETAKQARNRESSSNSPGEGLSEKQKGKRPRREEKK